MIILLLCNILWGLFTFLWMLLCYFYTFLNINTDQVHLLMDAKTSPWIMCLVTPQIPFRNDWRSMKKSLRLSPGPQTPQISIQPSIRGRRRNQGLNRAPPPPQDSPKIYSQSCFGSMTGISIQVYFFFYLGIKLLSVFRIFYNITRLEMLIYPLGKGS